ncbi:hypothetical protein BC834DRAFT_183534 [Gloeopeniophorella convolvens]|nr:hypothetical protein BC834DRAFT_183534 [Gloeopeniophorella convolvens]
MGPCRLAFDDVSSLTPFDPGQAALASACAETIQWAGYARVHHKCCAPSSSTVGTMSLQLAANRIVERTAPPVNWTGFLMRALHKSRSGFLRSDTVISYLIRQAIQTGLFASIFSIAYLVTWQWFRATAVFSIFAMNIGLLDTMVSAVHCLRWSVWRLPHLGHNGVPAQQRNAPPADWTSE